MTKYLVRPMLAMFIAAAMFIPLSMNVAPKAEAHTTGFYWTYEQGWYGGLDYCLRSGTHPHDILFCFKIY